MYYILGISCGDNLVMGQSVLLQYYSFFFSYLPTLADPIQIGFSFVQKWDVMHKSHSAVKLCLGIRTLSFLLAFD
jgi:hypothetical protein